LTLVTTEKMTEAIQRVDDLLKVDPEDRRHLFYEQMKDFFFALRDIQPEEIDDPTLDLLTQRADELMEVIHSIQWKRKQREKKILKFSI
jgi:regulator of sirC expression with transglutaminase-like and TPR domain